MARDYFVVDTGGMSEALGVRDASQRGAEDWHFTVRLTDGDEHVFLKVQGGQNLGYEITDGGVLTVLVQGRKQRAYSPQGWVYVEL